MNAPALNNFLTSNFSCCLLRVTIPDLRSRDRWFNYLHFPSASLPASFQTLLASETVNGQKEKTNKKENPKKKYKQLLRGLSFSCVVYGFDLLVKVWFVLIVLALDVLGLLR